ncbi:MAG: MmgE/PrpD family protein [Acidimicrobiia bacterium]|nr:MmgE/PrpD family protein [Acidimicrobiia bacterium]
MDQPTEPVLSTLSAWVEQVGFDDLPDDVVDLATTQFVGMLGALHAGANHVLGRRVLEAFPAGDEPGTAPLLPTGGLASPKRAAYVHAALTMVLDYDATAFAGHVCHSTANVPLAYAVPLGLSGREVILAQVAANEVAARITAAATLGPHRGQTATHTHLAGAATARAKAEGLSATALQDALGLALAQPGWFVYRGFMGSDAKVLTASTSIRAALDAVDAAHAGLHGAADIVEAAEGFLAKFAHVPVPAWADGLGERWHTRTLSFKTFPGCAYIDTCVEATLDLVQTHDLAPTDVDRIEVHGSVFTVGMDAHSRPYQAGPASSAVTLNFSVPYNVAVAIRRRALRSDDFSPEAIADPETWALAERVSVRHDPELDVPAYLGTAPVGAALRRAGEPGVQFLVTALGAAGDTAREAGIRRQLTEGGADDFTHPTKSVASRVVIHTTDGRSLECTVEIPRGAAGRSSHGEMRELMREKLRTEATRTLGPDAAADVASRAADLPTLTAAETEALVRANVNPAWRP